MDILELYTNTKTGTFVTAFSILKDRQLAREAAIEAYKRAEKLAYKFDESMSQEYWITDMVKNICTNGLKNAEISKRAENKLQDNISLLTKAAIVESTDERGVIVATKLSTGLSFSEVSEILWYRKYSLKSEYARCLGEVGKKAEITETDELECALKDDFEKITPEYYDLIQNDSYETCFKDVSEAYEKTPVKYTKRWTAVLVIAFAVLIFAATMLTIYFVKKKNTELKTEELYAIKEPQFGTSEAMIENNGKLYFENRSDKCYLYCYDTKAKTLTKLSDAKPKDFMILDSVVYFRNSASGHLSTINTETNEVTESDILGALPQAFGDKIVYSMRSGVALCDKNLSKDTEEVIFTPDSTLFIEKIVTKGNEIYISTGASMGIVRLTKTDAGSFAKDITLDTTEFYDIKIADGLIIYEDGFGSIIMINISNPNANTKTVLEFVLNSAAFCVDNETLYYYGEEGIYSVSIDAVLEGATKGELCVDLNDRIHSVSDLYVSAGNIYCYFSNGDNDNPYGELKIYQKGDKTSDGKSIFIAKK